MHRLLRSIDLLGGDDQRRHKADRVVVDRIDDEPCLEACLLKRFRSRLGKLDRLHKTEAANLFAAELVDRGVEYLSHLRRVADEPVALDDFEHCESGGASERIAAER